MAEVEADTSPLNNVVVEPASYGTLPNGHVPNGDSSSPPQSPTGGTTSPEPPLLDVAVVPPPPLGADAKKVAISLKTPTTLRPLHDLVLWWMSIGLSLAMLFVAAWVWSAFPRAPGPRHSVLNWASFLGIIPAILCPFLCSLQLMAADLKLPLLPHLQGPDTSKQLLYGGLCGIFLMCFGRLLQGSFTYYDQRAFLIYTLASSTLALVGAVGVHDKWHTLVGAHVLLWGGFLACHSIGASALLSYGRLASPSRWDWLLGPLWDRVVADSPIVSCSLEREFQCSGWTAACRFWRKFDPQCPACSYDVVKNVPCVTAIQASVHAHFGTVTALLLLLGVLLAVFWAAGAASLFGIVRRMVQSSAKAGDFRPGYWLACTDIQLLQRALLSEVESNVNDPMAYSIFIEHITHTKNCYRKEEAERASLLKGQQRWHYAVVNAGEHTSTGFHWGVGLWDGRTDPTSALLVDPYPSPVAFAKAVPYGRERGIAVELEGAGKQKCSWRCGYFSLWWVLWLDQQAAPPVAELPAALPAMPEKFPALCWALLGHMTTKSVQLRVNPEFRAQVAKGVIDLAKLDATEVAK